jgi:hypothetical protein
MAASGPTAFATSFAPCANDNKAAAKTNRILNKLLTDFFWYFPYLQIVYELMV